MRALSERVASHWRSLAASVLLLGALAAAAILLWPRPSPPLAVITPTPRPVASPLPQVVVHVTGAVANPGVYRLAAGSRAEDAIAAAGGLVDEADPGSLNLAGRLADGQQLVVKSKAAPAERAASASAEIKPAGKLNLNAASVADLDTLPGVGPVLAQRIVDRRQHAGPYQTVEQLRDEKILPAATYDRVKDLISVN